MTCSSVYGWIPDEDVLKTWQDSIHHPSQVIHHHRQAEEQRCADWKRRSVWGALCSESPAGCSDQHVLLRTSCSAGQWLVQSVLHPCVEVIDLEKQKAASLTGYQCHYQANTAESESRLRNESYSRDLFYTVFYLSKLTQLMTRKYVWCSRKPRWE